MTHTYCLMDLIITLFFNDQTMTASRKNLVTKTEVMHEHISVKYKNFNSSQIYLLKIFLTGLNHWL